MEIFQRRKKYQTSWINVKPRSNLRGKIPVIIIAILLILCLNFFSGQVRNAFFTISSPIQKIFWEKGQNASNFFGAISQSENLKNENIELKRKNQELLFEITELKALKNENQILRRALYVGIEKEFKLAFAQIISKDIAQDSILINKGSIDGIEQGMAVITQEKVLAGQITDVYENFARVTLISNKKSAIPGKIQEKEISGIIQGTGKDIIIFDLIPQEKEISQGEIIVSDILDKNFPQGLLMGEIKEIQKNDIEPFQQAQVAPFFDMNTADHLFIIIEY